MSIFILSNTCNINGNSTNTHDNLNILCTRLLIYTKPSSDFFTIQRQFTWTIPSRERNNVDVYCAVAC